MAKSAFMSGKSGDGVRLSSSSFEVEDLGRKLLMKSVEMEGIRGTGGVDEENLRRDVALELEIAETVRVERGAVDAEAVGFIEVDVFRVRERVRALEMEATSAEIVFSC